MSYQVMIHPEGYLACCATLLRKSTDYATARSMALNYLKSQGNSAAAYITSEGSGITIACWQNRGEGHTTVASPTDAEIFTIQKQIEFGTGVND